MPAQFYFALYVQAQWILCNMRYVITSYIKGDLLYSGIHKTHLIRDGAVDKAIL